MKTEESDSVGTVLVKILLAAVLMAAAVFIADATSGQLTVDHTLSVPTDNSLPPRD